MNKSRGHIMFRGITEYLVVGAEVYRAPTSSPLDIQGYRMGKRWECSVSHFNRYATTVFKHNGPPIKEDVQ